MKNEEVKVSASRIIFNFMWEFKVIRKISEKIFYSPLTKNRQVSTEACRFYFLHLHYSLKIFLSLSGR